MLSRQGGWMAARVPSHRPAYGQRWSCRTVDASRAARYADKLAHASDRLSRFLEWAPAASGDLKARLAAYKAFQEASEALSDVVAMIVKDSGRVPKDDYTNLRLLEEASVLSTDAAGALREGNGLRNRLVHEYGGLVDDVALASGKRLCPLLASVIEEVRRWISKNA